MSCLRDFSSPQHITQYFHACIISNKAFCEGKFTLSMIQPRSDQESNTASVGNNHESCASQQISYFCHGLKLQLYTLVACWKIILFIDTLPFLSYLTISLIFFFFPGVVSLDQGFSGGSEGKASARNAGDLGSILVWGRSPGEGNGNPLQYSGLENPMDEEAWQATARRVAKSQTGLSNFTFTFISSIMDQIQFLAKDSCLLWEKPKPRQCSVSFFKDEIRLDLYPNVKIKI